MVHLEGIRRVDDVEVAAVVGRREEEAACLWVTAFPCQRSQQNIGLRLVRPSRKSKRGSIAILARYRLIFPCIGVIARRERKGLRRFRISGDGFDVASDLRSKEEARKIAGQIASCGTQIQILA